MKDKIKSIDYLAKELSYLEGQYQSFKLSASNTDGYVEFEKLMDWLASNSHEVEHMLSVAESVKKL